MCILRTPLVATLIVLGITPAYSQPAAQPAPLLHHTFDQSDHGWMATGATAKVSVTHDAASLKVGAGAMRFDYGVNKGEMNMVLLLPADGVPAKTKSIAFWVKGDHDTSLGLLAQEREPGGRYVAPFAVTAGQWQKVEISLDEMTLSDGPDDPKDPNGKLNTDQIAGVALIDASQMFAGVESPDIVAAVNVKTGNHVLLLDDFVCNSAEIAPSVSGPPMAVVIDNFARPQAAWFAIGRAAMSIGSGKPMEGRYLKLDYTVGPRKLLALSRVVKAGFLAGSTSIRFSAAATKDAQLVVQVEEIGGGKYNATVSVKGGGASQTIVVALADLAPSNDSTDKNGTLDKELIKAVTMMDGTGILGQTEQANTLWIGPVTAK